jgi:threonine/homoserine/homoserine lactone efflux protein
MSPALRNFLLGIALAAPLGPSGVTIIQTGIRSGFLRAWLTSIGVILADATYLLLVFFGLSRFLEMDGAKIAVWTLGALALGYLGVRGIRDGLGEIRLERELPVAPGHPLLVGYLVNVSNPLAIVWWLGVFGSLLSESARQGTRLEALGSSSVIILGVFSWHSMVSFLTGRGGKALDRRLIKVVTVIAGAVLLLFGFRFAYSALSLLL